MSGYRAAFCELEGWESTAPGVRVKPAANGRARLRLVEMLSSAEHLEWCEVGHAGCVVEGVLEIEFEFEVIRFEGGTGS